MKALVGYTGFVGSNLLKETSFDKLYNSKNISKSFGTNPDLLLFAGLRAEKYLANKEPNKDFENVIEAIENIKKINPKIIVLVSTIDVYKTPINVNENSQIETEGLHPYGLNRYRLEKWVENNYENHLILHLPGLYGENIKKNFIYDLINPIPSMLVESKFLELSKKDRLIIKYYFKQDNGFYKCKEINDLEKNVLKQYFEKNKFSSLNFTDSRGVFQFYNLSFLWGHIEFALKNGIKKLNLATEPVSISELYKYLKKSDFNNKVTNNPPHYDFKTKYSEIFGGQNGYIFDKNFILEDINKFINKQRQ